MRQLTHQLSFLPHNRGALDITGEVVDWVRRAGLDGGLLTVYIQHTSASLLISENYDPAVMADLERFFARLAPDGDPLFRHTAEGPDDMPAHVRATLTQTSLSIPVLGGKLALGTWQGIYLYEHRTRPMSRRVLLHLIGE